MSKFVLRFFYESNTLEITPEDRKLLHFRLYLYVNKK